MREANFYASGGLDRASHLRRDEDWIAGQAISPDSRHTVLWRGQHLTARLGDDPIAHYLSGPALASLGGLVLFLGLDNAATVIFATDLSHLDDPLAALDLTLPETFSFEDLRAVGPVLARGDAAVLAYARGLANWHARHHFCGVCGSPAEVRQAGHLRHCVNADCAADHFPRTDPAVIMLVTDGDKCLLGRQAAWPPGMYSALAGFVEPGESLEQAVAREVFEETGVSITEATYHSSQPWPFPASLMLGFQARALDREIRIDGAELEDAQWFSREWLLARVDDETFPMSRVDSIARRLILDWLRG